jgi:choline-sulfatase
VAGCYGHPLVRTPNIDSLAENGALFASAYCNSPICVPARASLATGRYVHEIGCWDNAFPYRGRPESWHHIARTNGVDVVSIGKLHYRGGDDYGFSEELLPLHVVDGKGDLKGLFRKSQLAKQGTADLAASAGRGASAYSGYDARIAATAQDWLQRRAASGSRKRFVLFVSFVMPHFPLIAPEDYYDLYAGYGLDELSYRLTAPPPDHPTVRRMLRYFDYDSYFDDEKRAVALRAYFGMVTRLDELVGDLVATLGKHGLAERTRIIYASDHGDNLGNRGMWGKSVMYEDAVAIPLIISGADIPAGRTVTTPVSLVDIAPTVLHATGVPTDTDWPGESLVDLTRNERPERVVFSEYHAAGSDAGQFMIRKRGWKYVAYVGERPQLFDLMEDPDELSDLWSSPNHRHVVEELNAELETICDPVEVNARAFRDQQERIEEFGGLSSIEKTVDIPFTPAPLN